ncbi:MAG: FtsQ-type POTRA domain-containing protein [Anaerolineae bacterium]|nr:FtsQ-type POTRA domain-containing protein [Anaerolineae bacterium]
MGNTGGVCAGGIFAQADRLEQPDFTSGFVKNQQRTQPMTSSLKTKPRQPRREPVGRGHVRPSGESETPPGADAAPRRMRPRSQSQVSSPARVSQRRAERRARKRTIQAQRTPARSRRRAKRSSWLFSWRAVSGMIVFGLAVVLYLFLTAEAFFVNSVGIGGERYLSREEIFRFSDIAREHIFWIDPDDVEMRLEAVPNIADAEVYIGWPPDMVQIIVTEREPALIWEQGVRVWVDVNGIVMKQREDRPDLLRIVVPDAAEPLDAGARIPATIVDGALQLRRRHPNIDVLLYDPMKGLGYRDGRGWTVWFGTGDEIDVKLLVYDAVVRNIQEQKIQPGEIVVSDPDRPYYNILWREGE